MKNLFTTIKESLQVSDKKVNFFIEFMEGIIQSKTVNLNEVSKAMKLPIKKISIYRKIQRFLSEDNISSTNIAKLINSLVPKVKKILIIDRTEWKGVNMFYLGVLVDNIVIPIFWDNLDKLGSSNTTERKNLIEDYINVIGKENIGILMADREFIGTEWFKWLKKEEINFMIRVRSNLNIIIGNKSKKKLKNIFRNYKYKEVTGYVLEEEFRVMGKKLNKKETLIVITNCANRVLEEYSKRWGIENMFSCFKTRGFNMESTKLEDSKKLEKLFTILSLSYIWAIMVGKIYYKKDSKVRKDLGCRSKSIFKIGLERLIPAITYKLYEPEEYDKYFSIFSLCNKAFNNFVVE